MDFLTATQQYLPNEVIINLCNNPTKKENPGRIQKDEENFILPPKDIYHSCKPNAYIDWCSMNLKALELIPNGTTITYHYGTSEDDYNIGAFRCNCGNSNCVKLFRGCKYLTNKQRDRIRINLSPFLREKYYG